MKNISIAGNPQPLTLLQRCGGWYASPSETDQKEGMLVGYAGKYDDEHQWVGFKYANFAMAERYPHVMKYYARLAKKKYGELFNDVDIFYGAPMGGITFAFVLAMECKKLFGYAEKEVTQVKTDSTREQSVLVMNRHEIEQGQKVLIVEDVANNFSTTDKEIELVLKAGGTVVGLVCLLNRSLSVDDQYTSKNGTTIPVYSLVRQPIEQFRQDDPKVSPFIKAGRVVWKPKDAWHLLPQK